MPRIESTDGDTCRNVVARLEEYRDLAANSSMDHLLELQLGLDEFEAVTDFVADGQEWGDLMVEQLVMVRRDWSTAYAADRDGDEQTAIERFDAALGFLDAAIAVPCP